MPRALVVATAHTTRQSLSESFERRGVSAVAAGSIAEAVAELKKRPVEIVLTETRLEDGSGLDLLLKLPVTSRRFVILLADDEHFARTLADCGSQQVRCLCKPLRAEQLHSVLGEAIFASHRRLRRKQRLDRGRFGPMLGDCPAMREVYSMIAKVAPTDATVLIYGESGTGKELVARAIHERSARRGKPFVAVNCGAIPRELVESELFGHEKGAFTGAERARQGVFQRAHGGTLFLDEIGEMPPEIQVRLLRVLETGTVVRVGGESETHVDVRVVAATNRNPNEAVKEGDFREDLLFRLAVVPIHLPPLRERGEDVVLLANHYLALFNREQGTDKKFSPTAIRRLQRYHWPGNVRQLRNIVQRAVIMEGSSVDLQAVVPLLDGDELLPGVPASEEPRDDEAPNSSVALDVGTPIDEAEKKLILATLQQFDGDKKRTAKTLGISLKTLYNRLNSYAT